MAYDAELADRVREALAAQENVREVKMFGGLAFMVNEQLAVCVSGGGGLLVRVARGRDAEYREKNGAQRAEMGKEHRSMGEGWIAVDHDALEQDTDLQFWIEAVLGYNAEKTKERR